MPDPTKSFEYDEDGDDALFAADEDDAPFPEPEIDELMPELLDDALSLDHPPG